MQENAFENVVWNMAVIFSRPQCVNMTTVVLMSMILHGGFAIAKLIGVFCFIIIGE